VWGLVRGEDCEGNLISTETSLCAGAISTSFRFDTAEKLTPQLEQRTRRVVYRTEAVKRFCAAEWSWKDPPNTAVCRHSKVVA